MDPKHAHYVAVTGIIVKDGKYLITKRSPNEIAFPNKWAAPGGKIELDDYIKRKKLQTNNGIMFVKMYYEERLWKKQVY